MLKENGNQIFWHHCEHLTTLIQTYKLGKTKLYRQNYSFKGKVLIFSKLMVMKTIISNTCQSYERFGKKMSPQPCTS